MIIPKIKSKKLLATLVIAAILLVGAGTVFALQLTHPKAQPVASPDSKINKVNYGPPTKQEQAAGDAQKEQDIARQKAIDQSPTPSTAQVVVTDASYQQFDGNVVEIRAYIANIYEDGGQCTATLTLNGQAVTQTSTGFKDVKTTQCPTISIPRTNFPLAGNWQVIVKYTSTAVTGQSNPQTVVVK